MFGQVELLLRHGDVSHVPEDPEDQAEEHQQRSGQNKEIPVSQGCKDPDEEEEEAHNIQEYGDGQEDDGVLSLLHGL